MGEMPFTFDAPRITRDEMVEVYAHAYRLVKQISADLGISTAPQEVTESMLAPYSEHIWEVLVDTTATLGGYLKSTA